MIKITTATITTITTIVETISSLLSFDSGEDTVEIKHNMHLSFGMHICTCDNVRLHT